MSYTLTYAEKKEKFDEVVQQVIFLAITPNWKIVNHRQFPLSGWGHSADRQESSNVDIGNGDGLCRIQACQ